MLHKEGAKGKPLVKPKVKRRKAKVKSKEWAVN
jgi:hypothetical protein